MGYLFSVITSIGFTVYVFPKKISNQSPIKYSLFQGIGFFVVAAICYLFIVLTGTDGADRLGDPILLLSAVGGVMWSVASICFMTAIDRLGLSRSNQWKNLQGPAGAIFGLVFLSEHAQLKIIFVFLAIAFILISALLLNISSGEEKKANRSGIIFALLSAGLFGGYATVQKYVISHGFMYSQLLVISVTVLISSFIFLVIKEKRAGALLESTKKESFLGILGGSLAYLTLVSASIAYKYLPVSIAFTITQLNAVWTVLSGIFIFREISFKENYRRILGGLAFAVLGVIMLLFAQ